MKNFIKDVKEFLDIREILETNPLEAFGLTACMVIVFIGSFIIFS